MLFAAATQQEPIDYGLRAPRPPEGKIDLPGLFSSAQGPLEIDIGFGRGQSLFARKAAAPDARLLGLEIKTKLVVKVQERIAARKLDNMRVFAADVLDVLTRTEPDACVDRVFISFPDPWWKRRHLKRAVVSQPLLHQLARLLKMGGEVFIQTDVQERALVYRDLLVNDKRFALHPAAGWAESNPFCATSNRELRAARDGLPVYRLLARRVE